jgi:DNA-binding NarL/FixJ family response regulator
MANAIRIVLADDHPLFAEGIAMLLNSIEGIEVVGIANTGREVLQLLKENTCSLALLDVHMPGMDGIETSRQIKLQYPHIQIVALTMEEEVSIVEKMKQAGASGYVLKTADKPTLLQAILLAMSQEYTNKEVKPTEQPVPGIGSAPEDSSKQPASGRGEGHLYHTLTDREIEILHLIAQGYSTPQMADKLSISPKTVETHRKNMLKKVKVKNIMGLIKYGIQYGIIKIKP